MRALRSFAWEDDGETVTGCLYDWIGNPHNLILFMVSLLRFTMAGVLSFVAQTLEILLSKDHFSYQF